MIAVGRLAGPHGVKGHAKFFFFGENPDLIDQKGPLFDKKGTAFTLKKERIQKNFWLVRIAEHPDRTAIEKLPKTELFINKELLDEIEEENEFYYEDLIGLPALNETNEQIGTIQAIHNFGASDLIEIKPQSGKSFMLPFTEHFIPETSEKHITIANYTELV